MPTAEFQFLEPAGKANSAPIFAFGRDNDPALVDFEAPRELA
jgi:hypothetical protein